MTAVAGGRMTEQPWDSAGQQLPFCGLGLKISVLLWAVYTTAHTEDTALKPWSMGCAVVSGQATL